ncbi:MAG: hypothetical protein ACI8X5_003659, partial [Planctomycetota bacterium]
HALMNNHSRRSIPRFFLFGSLLSIAFASTAAS